MSRASLRRRLEKLEAARKEDPAHVYLRCLLAYIGKAREARQTGSEAAKLEALALRRKLEDLRGPA